MKKEIITGLDVGSSSVRAVIAERTDGDEQLSVVGVGCAASDGLRFGVVVDIENTVQAISEAIEQAERMAGVRVTGVYTGISGDHIRSNNCRGVVAVARGRDEIGQDDVARAIEVAKVACLPIDREIIHVIPMDFKVDDQDGVVNPLGMCGNSLEANIHLVTAAPTLMQNIVKCIYRSGFEIYNMVLASLAASNSVLSEDEKNLGISLIDIGGGTTDIAIFSGGSVRYSSVLGLAGDNLTNAISIGLRTPAHQAQAIKEKYGCALHSQAEAGEMLDIPGVSTHPGRQVSSKLLASIIKPRVEEILGLAFRKIKDSNLPLDEGVVITGGSGNLARIARVCEEIMNLPVRIGRPAGVGGLKKMVDDPAFATAVGLVLCGASGEYLAGEDRFTGAGGSVFGEAFNRLRRWTDNLW